jgi:AraC family transcriptional regulator
MAYSEYYRKQYIQRINCVIDYIESHLDGELNLEKLAHVAHFSPYHFHRIFSAFKGETLNNFIKRKKIEKAGSRLLNDKEASVSQIAYECGFNSFPVFCRTFKEHFGMSAREFRTNWMDAFSKNGQMHSKNDKLEDTSYLYFSNENQNIWRYTMKNNIEIKEMPAMNLIYCRHTGPFYLIGQAYEKLMKWAGPRGLLDAPDMKTATVYHEDPKVTQLDQLHQSACITVNGDVKPEGEFGKMTVPGGKHVVGHFEISETEFQKAWDSMSIWLSESGYQPADGYPYELYHNDHSKHPERKFILDICIPVKPM